MEIRKFNLERERRKRGLCPDCGEPPTGGWQCRIERPNGRGAYVCMVCSAKWNKEHTAPQREPPPETQLPVRAIVYVWGSGLIIFNARPGRQPPKPANNSKRPRSDKK
jgi:hypothetical protein